MQFLYTLRATYNEQTAESWSAYKELTELEHLTELVSVDSGLNELLIDPNNLSEDYFDNQFESDEFITGFFKSYDFILKQSENLIYYNLLTVAIEPDQECRSVAIDDFEFLGYDLLDKNYEISVLANCGGFPETFANSELNCYGLLDDWAKAKDIQRKLIVNNPDEPLAETNIIAIWRHKHLGRYKSLPTVTHAEAVQNIDVDENLEILADAISDVGFWNWWATDLPELVVLEFGGTQLIIKEGTNKLPPSTQISLRFIHPKSAAFISKQTEQFDGEKWYDLLYEDRLSQPNCDRNNFTFTDEETMQLIINEATEIETIFGYSPKDEKFHSERFKLVFWADDYGFAVAADEFKIYGVDGEIPLESIQDLSAAWWDYWTEYWKANRAGSPLPKDYACEVTIPAGE